MSRFTSILLVSPLADGRTWIIRQEFGYDVGAQGSDDQITVPVGFQTDFASIPRPFWVILPQWGKYGSAAVIHDWLYWDQNRSRAASDAVLLESMVVSKVGFLVRYAIYTAVRLFGWLAWYRNQADRVDGFQRVLQTVPVKPITAIRRRGQYLQLARHVLRRTGPSS
jgi:hypothetical protein